MKKSLISVAIAIAVAGGTSGALAQTATAAEVAQAGTAANSTARAKRFADQFAAMQSLSGTGTAWVNPPTPGLIPDDPTKGLNFAEMQAESSNSAMWQPQAAKPSAVAAAPADPVGSRGLSIAQYQALSDESATWQVPVQAASTAVASSANPDAAQASSKRPFAERWAALFHRQNNSEGSAR